MMEIIILTNGLGNQMSQFAFYLAKKGVSNKVRLLPISYGHNGIEIERLFNVKIRSSFGLSLIRIGFRLFQTDLSRAGNFHRKLFQFLGFNVINENYDYRFNPRYLKPSKGITIFNGGWPSANYFDSIKSKLPKVFSFPPLDERNVLKSQLINNCNSVSIHIRRGDYLQEHNKELFGDICTVEYYRKAIALMLQRIEKPVFFIFSNDIKWCKEELGIAELSHFIDYNSGIDSWKDLVLMSMCKHNIIANSSFSWWAAWLNKNTQKIVVRPNLYSNSGHTENVYCDDWLSVGR